MDYGNWELRSDSFYWFSKDAWAYPSSNAIDSGKIHSEENIRNIYRDLSGKNFVLKYNYFNLNINAGRTAIIVSPGEAIIQGYHFYTKNIIEVAIPSTNVYQQWTLGISLVYDAANHITGDIVNKALAIGESEILSGVYIKWFNECELECAYDNILVLGRAWSKNGVIVPDGTKIDEKIIYHGFEADPLKDHRYYSKNMEVQVHGHKLTKYDTLYDNMTEIHNANYTYDSMHYPIELERNKRTKAPTFVTDLQDYIDHIPDWYTSKYGDYMTGALRFNNVSIDGKREFLGQNIAGGIIKDSTDNEFADSLILSPRTYGDLTRTLDQNVENNDYDYDVGGTVLSIVPSTYSDNADGNNGYTGIHAALVSQKWGESGLRIHCNDGNTSVRGLTRLVHYTEDDLGKEYDKDNNNDLKYLNTSKFIIENTSGSNGRKASINIKNGEVFFDSFQTADTTFNGNEDTSFSGNYKGSGFQFYVGPYSQINNNISFRIDTTKISMAEHLYEKHRFNDVDRYNDNNANKGLNTDRLHFIVGLGINHDNSGDYNDTQNLNDYSISYGTTPKDPYLTLGNIRIRSNQLTTRQSYKQNTIEVMNHDSGKLPYIRIKPRVYTEQYLAEELLQVGTQKYNDYESNNAQTETLNRILLKRINTNSKDNTNDAFTIIEQDYRHSNGSVSGLSKVFTKIRPPKNNINIQDIAASTINYGEIAGIYSAGNIGASSAILNPSKNGNLDDENSNDKNNPYTNDNEWVRFTRFRYALDKDQVNGGMNTEDHSSANGRKWGDTYNIEFNTNVANRRANQIIFRYKGSTGTQDDELNNTPPGVISYVHDTNNVSGGSSNTNDAQGIGTQYSDGNVQYETYYDHNGIAHFTPTCKIRDFLLFENLGISISGDINNPALSGDVLNSNNHFGVTIVHGRIYNSVYNDLAETFEKENVEDFVTPGDIIVVNAETTKYEISSIEKSNLVVGVHSNTYGYLLGGNRVNNTQDIIDLENEYYTVAISGKVWVNVIDNSEIKPGDFIETSNIKGKGQKSIIKELGTIVGKALSKPKYFEEHNCEKVLMLVQCN